MRILHVAYSCVPGAFRGGVPKVVYELAAAQADHGHDVHVFTTTMNSSVHSGVPGGSVREQRGVAIHYFDVSNPRWFSSAGLKEALERHGGSFDVVHGHSTFLAPNRYVHLLGERTGTPAFFHVHGALDPVMVNKGYFKRIRKQAYIRLLERRQLNAAAGVFALTESERDQLLYWGVTSPVHVVPNGVALAPRTAIAPENFRARWKIQESERLIVFVGRIVPKKGVHVLIDAFAEVVRSDRDARLVIAGDRAQDPSYVAALDQRIEGSGISSRVTWTGHLNEEQKASLLASAHVFSHVTESEGMALSVLEAMAFGLPTVVSKECNMGNAVEQGAVLEVAFAAPAIAREISRLLRTPDLAREYGNAAAGYVERNHSWPRIADAILRAYSTRG